MDKSLQSSQDSIVPQTQLSLPTTPITAPAELPFAEKQSQTSASSLTPPPSSQADTAHRVEAVTPIPALSQLSSPPPSTSLRSREDPNAKMKDAKMSQEQVNNMSNDELRKTVSRLTAEVQDAKTTAAHYKLQHQMAQMESGEAVERMAVEMEMARREIEVLQQSEAQRRYIERSTAAAPTDEDANYRKIHKDVYAAMTDELRELKINAIQMGRGISHSRMVIEQQENEIASLNDKVLLMRDRIKESREQLMRYRRMGMLDTTPHTVRTTPFQTPVRERFRPLQPSHSQQQQPGFAALLQATDIVSQGGKTPGGAHERGHSRNTHSLSSLPTTPSRSAHRQQPHALYTPQPPRQMPIEIPQTAPVPRKRTMVETITPPRQERRYDSDGTVSAAEDSEAETEVADGDVGQSRASQMARDLLRSPTAKRAKSAHNLKGMTQTKLFGQVTKANTPRSDEGREAKRSKVSSKDVGLGIAGVRERQAQESTV